MSVQTEFTIFDALVFANIAYPETTYDEKPSDELYFIRNPAVAPDVSAGILVMFVGVVLRLFKETVPVLLYFPQTYRELLVLLVHAAVHTTLVDVVLEFKVAARSIFPVELLYFST